ncbi:MAG: DUF975 family protein [Clostridia bacterium]|nr:DUF975 family protein [Clostridia bacterium]
MYNVFDRAQMKERAKVRIKRNYWYAFLVSFLTSIFVGGFSFPSFNTGGMNINNLLSEEPALEDSIGRMDPTVVGVMAILLIVILVIFTIAFAISICRIWFVGNVFQVGKCNFYLNHAREQDRLHDFVQPFGVKGKAGYLNIVKVLIRRDLKLIVWEIPILAAWLVILLGIFVIGAGADVFGMLLMLLALLLALIGGPIGVVMMTIKAYEYSMIPYLLAEHTEMTAAEAFAASKALTNGYKWELFVVDLSFIGWNLLGALCFGVGSYFVAPYVDATGAEVYITLCRLLQQKNAPSPNVNMDAIASHIATESANDATGEE